MPSYRVTATELFAREGPRKSSPWITKLPNGKVVERLEVDGSGKWFRVRFDALDRTRTRSVPVEAWVSAAYLAPVEAAAAPPPWLERAYRELGVREKAGAADNPRILEYQRTTPDIGEAHDSIPWCSSFVNWCVEQEQIPGTRSGAARSWQRWGTRLRVPRLGCIAVFKRSTDPTRGHVGFYVGETPDAIKVLGGNQSDQVMICTYAKERLVALRWPGA